MNSCLEANQRMKNGVARGSYICRTCLDNVCDRESCATPENGQHGVNSSVDMNMQLVNVNGTEYPSGDMNVHLA